MRSWVWSVMSISTMLNYHWICLNLNSLSLIWWKNVNNGARRLSTFTISINSCLTVGSLQKNHKGNAKCHCMKLQHSFTSINVRYFYCWYNLNIFCIHSLVHSLIVITSDFSSQHEHCLVHSKYLKHTSKYIRYKIFK